MKTIFIAFVLVVIVGAHATSATTSLSTSSPSIVCPDAAAVSRVHGWGHFTIPKLSESMPRFLTVAKQTGRVLNATLKVTGPSGTMKAKKQCLKLCDHVDDPLWNQFVDMFAGQVDTLRETSEVFSLVSMSYNTALASPQYSELKTTLHDVADTVNTLLEAELNFVRALDGFAGRRRSHHGGECIEVEHAESTESGHNVLYETLKGCPMGMEVVHTVWSVSSRFDSVTERQKLLDLWEGLTMFERCIHEDGSSEL